MPNANKPSDIRLHLETVLAPLQRDMPDQAEGMKSVVEPIISAVEDYHTELADLKQRGVFTAKGLEERAAERRDTLGKAFRNVEETVISNLDFRMSQDRAAALRPTTPEDKVVAFQQEREIRDLLRQKDRLEVRLSYLDAARTGENDDLLRAVENAPKAFPLVDAAARKEADDLKVQRINPFVSDLFRIREFYDYALKQARRSVGIERTEPITL